MMEGWKQEGRRGEAWDDLEAGGLVPESGGGGVSTETKSFSNVSPLRLKTS